MQKGAMLAAMAAGDAHSTALDLAHWLDENEVGWKPKEDLDPEEATRATAIRGAKNKLGEELSDIPVGLERFGPNTGAYAIGQVTVKATFP